MRQPRFWIIASCFVLTCCGSVAQITLSGLVNELGGADGLADAQVCVVGLKECVTTQSDGTYTFSAVPGNSEISLTVDKPGYLGGVIPVSDAFLAIEPPPASEVVPVISLGSSILVDLQMGILDVDALADTGQVAFSISNGVNGDGINVADMRVSLIPSGGDGPFYSNEGGLPDPGLEQTSANGGGVFVNLAPGRYTLNHLNLPQNCTPMLGWGEASAITFEVMVNRVTYARVECMEPSSP